jgi:hypothetical protein
MSTKTLAFERNLIGAARRVKKTVRLGSDSPPTSADNRASGARSRHVIALTAANSGSRYVPITRR